MKDELDIEVEIVLPVQLLNEQFRGARLQPEKRLQLAVLADAVMTHARGPGISGGKAQATFTELDEWLGSDSAVGPFSFVAICDSLGFDPGYIRRGLRLLRPGSGTPRERRLSLYRDRGSRTQVVGARVRRIA